MLWESKLPAEAGTTNTMCVNQKFGSNSLALRSCLIAWSCCVTHRTSASFNQSVHGPCPIQLRRPVDHDGDRQQPGFDEADVDQESLPVSRDIVLVISRFDPEERCGRAGLETRPGPHRHGDQSLVGGEIEQLFSVAPPARTCAAGSGDLPFHLLARARARAAPWKERT